MTNANCLQGVGGGSPKARVRGLEGKVLSPASCQKEEGGAARSAAYAHPAMVLRSSLLEQ